MPLITELEDTIEAESEKYGGYAVYSYCLKHTYSNWVISYYWNVCRSTADKDLDKKDEIKKEPENTIFSGNTSIEIDSNGFVVNPPDIESEVEISSQVETEVTTAEEKLLDEKESEKCIATPENLGRGRYERTFITFSDESTFRKAFPERKPPKPREPRLCPITR